MKRFVLLISVGFLLAANAGCASKGSYHMTPVGVAFTVIGFLTFLFIVMGIYTNLLRDEVNDCDEFDANVAKIENRTKRPLLNREYPFSLPKVQLAAWTLVIASSYIYLALCRSNCADGTINKTALVLMGIGAGIATASALIDKKEIRSNVPRHQNHPSEGFFADILSDDNGISIHRFQNVVWTLIAMIIYIAKVGNNQQGCDLPELSDTLLILTGISSATFLTLRASENQPDIQAVQQQSQPGKASVPDRSSAVSGPREEPATQ